MSEVKVGHAWEQKHWDWPLEHNDGVVKVTDTVNQFHVSLDMPFFTPDEVKVSVQGDHVVIRCEHQERKDSHGTITRSIARTYALPPDVDKATLKSELSARGHLHITASKLKK